MLRNAIRAVVLMVSVFLAGAAFAAGIPTLEQVHDAAQAGHMNEALSMMQQVLKEHPNSAKAHFVNAELLAKVKRFSEARDELGTAERLQPGLTGEKPEAVQALRALLGESRGGLAPASATQHGEQGGFHWSLLILGIAAIVVISLIMRMLARPAVVAAPYPGANPGNYPAGGYQPGMPPAGGMYGAPPAPGMGSTILGGLATGAAVGAGMVAGEALAHRLIDGDHGSANPQPTTDASYTQPGVDTQSYNMGGNDFGVVDSSSWDDSSVVADGSSSGDDWT